MRNLGRLSEVKYISATRQGIYQVHLCLWDTFAHEQFNSFEDYSIIFNGNVICPSKAVAVPLDAEDVSKYVFLMYSCSPLVIDVWVTGSFCFVGGTLSLLQ